MSSKILQLSPQASTQVIRRRIAAQNSWSAAPAPSLDMSLDLSLDIGFLRSWFECESDLAQNTGPRRVNWGAISGLALSVAVSVICWAGLAWIVTSVWK
ncbi:MAG TPA: hypothetical protein VKF84_11665 [Candidatus Sulfotelmatobacter sp.]|nr:hypothetical protein [Candidatus Sulfotelmatobacter sp.]